MPITNDTTAQIAEIQTTTAIIVDDAEILHTQMENTIEIDKIENFPRVRPETTITLDLPTNTKNTKKSIARNSPPGEINTVQTTIGNKFIKSQQPTKMTSIRIT